MDSSAAGIQKGQQMGLTRTSLPFINTAQQSPTPHQSPRFYTKVIVIAREKSHGLHLPFPSVNFHFYHFLQACCSFSSLSEDCISYFTEKFVEIRYKFHQSHHCQIQWIPLWSLTFVTFQELETVTSSLLKHSLRGTYNIPRSWALPYLSGPFFSDPFISSFSSVYICCVY